MRSRLGRRNNRRNYYISFAVGGDVRFYKQLFPHRPSEGLYGDCVRTAIACLLDREPSEVPHFFDKGQDGETAWKAIEAWLAGEGLGRVMVVINGTIDRKELIDGFSVNNPDVCFMLFGTSSSGTPHVVICRNGEIIHDPSFIDTGISGPTDGYYLIVVLVPRFTMLVDETYAG